VREIQFRVEHAGERLDKLIQQHLPDISRSQIQTLIKDGQVTVDDKQVKAGVKLRGGETIKIQMPAAPELNVEPENIPLSVVYEDADIVVLDKPAGLVVHPGAGNLTGTLVNALLARYPEMMQMQGTDEDEDEGRIGIVHRLDKDTSGLMVVARHLEALTALMEQFKERTVEKHYLALLERTPKTLSGVIDAPIGRDPQQRKQMRVLPRGRKAITEFEIIETDFRGDYALVRCKPLTGRTHQIRVHMAFIGCPIVGDKVYGIRKSGVNLKRHFLHAAQLVFDHPMTGARLTFESPLPVGLQNTLDKLR
jgi:23S rRNA pseudouridine1911/1915/1917 synthase